MGLLRETREIAFGALALRRVVGWAPEAARAALGLPPGVPGAVVCFPVEGTIALRYGGGPGGAASGGAGDDEVSLRAEALGALLMGYCLRVRLLQTARGVRRSVRVLADAVVLSAARDLDDLPDPGEVPVAAGAVGPVAPATRDAVPHPAMGSGDG